MTLDEARNSAHVRARLTGKPVGIWRHVGCYGRPEGDVQATGAHTVKALDLPDPPDWWALVECVDPPAREEATR